MIIIKKYGPSIIVVGICLISLLFISDKNAKLEKENSILKVEKQIIIDNNKTFSYLNSITVESFEKKVESGKDIFVYIGNSQCSDCSFFSKTLEKEIRNSSIGDALNLVEISNIHQNKDKWLSFKRRYGFDQTPAFLIFQKGKVKSILQWNETNGLSEKSFHNWLEENRDLIKKIESK